jgi:hypothetical protein
MKRVITVLITFLNGAVQKNTEEDDLYQEVKCGYVL